ncbi:MAG: MFS transporter [Betaproteobacteria bacterium]|nr:MFS transporter [Betaproteobacteria bacterium]
MRASHKTVAILAGLQALLFTGNSVGIAIHGLAGLALAENKALATLPVTGWVIGAAIATFPASLLMKRIGRRAGFTVGALIGVVGAGICSAAVALGSFWLLCLGTMVFGANNGFGQYFRFAAADGFRSCSPAAWWAGSSALRRASSPWICSRPVTSAPTCP